MLSEGVVRYSTLRRLLQAVAGRLHKRYASRGRRHGSRAPADAAGASLSAVSGNRTSAAGSVVDGDIFSVLGDRELSGTVRHALFEAMSNGGGPTVDIECPARCYDKVIVWDAVRHLRNALEETADGDAADGGGATKAAH